MAETDLAELNVMVVLKSILKSGKSTVNEASNEFFYESIPFLFSLILFSCIIFLLFVSLFIYLIIFEYFQLKKRLDFIKEKNHTFSNHTILYDF